VASSYNRILPRRRLEHRLHHARRNAGHDVSFEPDKGLGPTLQIAEGYVIDLPDEVHQVLDERTDPTWPTTWFVPNLTDEGAFTDVYSVMNNWGANHGAIAYGHIGADLISLAAMLRIPIDMHNVSADKVFRPSSWSRFGTHEPQAGDYRACETYGPLYK
jgi:L-fucose isomerase